jgi:hypothetical protein
VEEGMVEMMAGARFDPELAVESLPKPVLIELWRRTAAAHEHLFSLWQETVKARFGEEVSSELVAEVAPDVAAGAGLRQLFFDDLNMMAGVVKMMPGMLTVAEYQDDVFVQPLTPDLNPEALSNRGLALLWNVTALAYMFVTNRWYEAVAPRFGESVAQALEKEVWLDRGAAEDDLRIGLDAANATGGDVETLLRGFQLAPGEVGLLEVDFDLQSSDHGWLIHRRCPAWDRFGNQDPGRREHSCVICVIGMRLSGEMIAPRIRCRPASLPPHREPRDHACKWEYWLEAGEDGPGTG